MPPSGSTFGLVHDYRYGPAFTEVLQGLAFSESDSFAYKITGLYVERIRAVTFTVETDDTDVDRWPNLSWVTGMGNQYGLAALTAAIPASSFVLASFSIGAAPAGNIASGRITAPLPSLFMQPGDTLSIFSDQEGDGDTAVGLTIVTEKFSTADRDFPPGVGGALDPETQAYVDEGYEAGETTRVI